MSDTPEYYCEECEAEFRIIHDEVNEPSHCPFCSAALDLRELDDEEPNTEED